MLPTTITTFLLLFLCGSLKYTIFVLFFDVISSEARLNSLLEYQSELLDFPDAGAMCP